MDAWVWVVIIIGIAIIAAVAWMFMQRRRSEQLQERFGPEYERTESEYGDRRRAESALEARKQRVERLDIRPLSDTDSTRFADSWHSVQSRFVDDPAGATTDADLLVTEVMEARGYPVGDFEQRASDISVDHPGVVKNYRAAHEIALRNGRGEASTDDLRQAMVSYRDLFEELLGRRETERPQAR